MTNISRVDQALLLLKDRLRRVQERGGKNASATSASASRAANFDPLASVRSLARQGQVSEQNIRRALVGGLLTDALGEELVATVEFQSLVSHVLRILEDSEDGRQLLAASTTEILSGR